MNGAQIDQIKHKEMSKLLDFAIKENLGGEISDYNVLGEEGFEFVFKNVQAMCDFCIAFNMQINQFLVYPYRLLAHKNTILVLNADLSMYEK